MVLHSNYFQIFIICLLALIQSGLVSTETQLRIVSGRATSIDKIPYLVQLRNNGRFLCGGSIVARRYIVTAAHCVKGMPASDLTVIAGAGELLSPGVLSKVVKIMIPKGFNLVPMTMDVAVLKLKTPLKGPYIRRIRLCNKGWNPGANFKVFGWGRTKEDVRLWPNQVRTVNVTSIAKSTCSAEYTGYRQLTDAMFCASTPHRKDVCYGDSGGPAVLNGKLCGIISWGRGCGRYPSVYTNVNKVKAFILKAINKL